MAGLGWHRYSREGKPSYAEPYPTDFDSDELIRTLAIPREDLEAAY